MSHQPIRPVSGVSSHPIYHAVHQNDEPGCETEIPPKSSAFNLSNTRHAIAILLLFAIGLAIAIGGSNSTWSSNTNGNQNGNGNQNENEGGIEINQQIARSHPATRLPAALSPSSLLFAASPSSSSSSSSSDSSSLSPSPNDSRLYRSLTLPNSLPVLLISDSSSSVSSAALSVGVGSWQDGTRTLGLAHFLEHMLFMGTEKYPDENDYEKYLAHHGGGSDAETFNEWTDYYFDIESVAFEGALDRFAQFFISPLIKESSVRREMHAVDSEHQTELHDDEARLLNLIMITANPQHPWSAFSTGTLETLDHEGVREELVDLYRKYYSANRMRLVVLGREELDTLEDWTRKYFTDIPNNNLPPLSYSTSAYGPQYVRKYVRAQPESNVHHLALDFPLDSSFISRYLEDPLGYISYHLNHQSEGSIIFHLRELGLATSISTKIQVDSPDFQLYQVDVDLTRIGLERVDEVIGYVLAYLEMMRESEDGVSEKRWEEIHSIEQLNFTYQAKQEPMDYTSSLSTSLQIKDMKYILGSPDFKYFNASCIRESLNQLVASNVNIQIASSAFPANLFNQVDPIYGTKFRVDKIPQDFDEKWASMIADRRSLSLPPSNPYLDFDSNQENILLPLNQSATDHPILLMDTPLTTVWYRQDSHFILPKVNVYIDLIIPNMETDIEIQVMLGLYVSLVDLSFQSESYLAGLVGYTHTYSQVPTGLRIELSGYTSKMEIYLNHTLAALTTKSTWMDPFRYLLVQQAMEQELDNFNDEQVYEHAIYFVSLLTEKHEFSKTSKKKVVSRVKLDEIVQLIKGIDEIKMRLYVYGNVDETTVRKYAQAAQFQDVKAISDTRLWPSHLLLQPPLGESVLFQSPSLHPSDANACALVHFPVCQFNDDECSVAWEIILAMITEPAFDRLRTQEQLGYIVFAFPIEQFRTVKSLNIVVQGTDHQGNVLDERIQDFIGEFSIFLHQNLTDDFFKTQIQSAIVSKNQDILTMDDLSKEDWNEIIGETFRWERKQNEIQLFQKLTKENVIQWWDQHISHEGNRLRKIAIQIFGNQQTTLINPNNARTSSSSSSSSPLSPSAFASSSSTSLDSPTVILAASGSAAANITLNPDTYRYEKASWKTWKFP